MTGAKREPVTPDGGNQQGGGLPWGLLLGIALGVIIGLIRQDVAAGAGLAVALGICFWFLSPLVREYLNKQKSDNTGNLPENGD